jgi:hypothetical protein
MLRKSILVLLLAAIYIITSTNYYSSSNDKNYITYCATTELQEPDLQTKTYIYLGLPMRLRGSENNNFV